MPVIGRRLQLAMLCKLVLSKSDFLRDSVIARRLCGEVFAAVNSPERHKEPRSGRRQVNTGSAGALARYEREARKRLQRQEL